MAKKLTKKPAKKAAPKTKAPKQPKKPNLAYSYVTVHWISFNGRTGEMVGLFSRIKGEVFSLVKVMEEAIAKLEQSGNAVASVTIKNFFDVDKAVAELYLKEKVDFEAKRTEIVNQFVADRNAETAKAKAELEAAKNAPQEVAPRVEPAKPNLTLADAENMDEVADQMKEEESGEVLREEVTESDI